MPSALKISANWERLEQGTPEEKACFAALGIQCNNIWLTEGIDNSANRVRTEPFLSGYHLAEWLAWNWWRLRWEPRSKVADWVFAHRLSTIGEGYAWPNITVFSDGQRTALISKPSPAAPATSFRYISNVATIVPSDDFEFAVDEFINQILGQLKEENIQQSNLMRLWPELLAERRDRVASERRKLEALLGHEPDQGDAAILDRLLDEARQLGTLAIEELAANHAQGGPLPTIAELETVAQAKGYDTSRSDIVKFGATDLRPTRDTPAWLIGATAARQLREQVGLGSEPITNSRLTEMAGAPSESLSDGAADGALSFIMSKGSGRGRLVFRSKWGSGRRFELARLLADSIISTPHSALSVATRAYTYRQKMQRSFAAEFLSPFDAAEAMLDGDYSDEKQSDVARYFGVSGRTIQTLLVNHHRLDRETIGYEFYGDGGSLAA